MRFLYLIWAGMWRAPVRTLLVLLQIAVAFTLFGLLNGMNGALKQAVDKQRADVLYVSPRVNGTAMPRSHLDKIEQIDGVRIANPQNFFAGTFQTRTQRVTAVATDPTRYFAINDYCKVDPEHIVRLTRTRDGAIVGAELVRKYGWRIGDRVPLQSVMQQKNGSRTWSFEIVGVYEFPDEPDMANLLIINNDYFEEARRTPRPNTLARIVVKTDSLEQVPDVIETIDETFANSAAETATRSENESAQTRLESLGDLDFVARSVTSAAFLALLLSVGTMMMSSIRERTEELGVLMAIGFSNRTIGSLVLTEAVICCVAAATLGLAVASALLPLARKYAGLVEMPISVVITGEGAAIALAIVCAWIPARYATTLQVVNALARR